MNYCLRYETCALGIRTEKLWTYISYMDIHIQMSYDIEMLRTQVKYLNILREKKKIKTKHVNAYLMLICRNTELADRIMSRLLFMKINFKTCYFFLWKSFAV